MSEDERLRRIERMAAAALLLAALPHYRKPKRKSLAREIWDDVTWPFT